MFRITALISGQGEWQGFVCASFSMSKPENLRNGVRVLKYKVPEYDQIDFNKVVCKHATRMLYVEKLFVDGALVFDGTVDV